MVKVLHVVGIMNRGGIETFVMNVLHNIDSSRFNCDILCTLRGIGDYDDEAREIGVSVFHIGESFQSHRGKLRFIGQFQEYRKWFAEHPYDVVHIHGSHAFDNLIAVKAALASACPMVICHSHNSDGLHKKLNAIAAAHLRALPIVRLACSRKAGEWLYGDLGCFEVIRNGIDVERFVFREDERKVCRALLGIPDNAKVIVHTGRLVAVKNQSFLLDIVESLLKLNSDNWHLLLIGVGDDDHDLRNKASSLGIEGRVHFLGLRDDIPLILTASDIYVMPSIHEGLPLAAVEAQANGLPALLSKSIAPETRILSTTSMMDLSFGADAWARAVAELLSCSLTKDRCVGGPVVKAAGFDISATVARLQEIYSESNS